METLTTFTYIQWEGTVVRPVKTVIKSNSVSTYRHASSVAEKHADGTTSKDGEEYPAEGHASAPRRRFQSRGETNATEKSTYLSLEEAQKFFTAQLKDRCNITISPIDIHGDNVSGFYQMLYGQMRQTAASPKKLRWWGQENRRLIQLSRARITVEKQLPSRVMHVPAFQGIKGKDVFSSRQQAEQWILDMAGRRGLDTIRHTGVAIDQISESTIQGIVETLFRSYYIKSIDAMGYDRATECMNGEEGRILIRNLSAAKHFVLFEE